jgi:O-antigen/teichoic acid export membrane protein
MWGHKLASMGASLFIMGAAIRLYGPEQMGIWIFATSLATYLALLDFGTASALPRILPRLRHSHGEAEINRIVSTAFGLALLAALLAITVFGFLNDYLLEMLMGTRITDPGQQIVLEITVLAALLAVPLRVGYGLLASLSRFDLYFGIDLIGVLARVALVFGVVVAWQAEMMVFALVATLPPLLANIAQFATGIRHAGVRIGWRDVSFANLGDILSHTGASLLLTFSTMLLIQGGTLASAQLSLVAVTIFAIPLMLVTQAMSFGASTGALVAPVASALSVGGGDKLREIVMGAIGASMSISVLVALSLYVVGPVFLQWWLAGDAVGQGALEEMRGVLNVLLVGALLIAPTSVARGVLLGTGSHWSSATVEFGGAVLGLVCGMMLMTSFDMGVAGLAWGFVLGYVSRFAVMVVLLARVAQVGMVWLVLAVIKPLLFGVLGLFLAITWFGWPSPDSGVWLSALRLILACFVWAVGTWLFVLNALQRQKVVNKFL